MIDKVIEKMRTITVIGGGFSGTLLLANLINKASAPLKVILVDKSGDFGTGLAFMTQDPSHLLNVRAFNMGAYADDPGHFYKWLQENKEIWRALDPAFSNLEICENSYIPRKIYGYYLKSILKQTLDDAKQKNISISLSKEEVVRASLDSENKIDLTYASGDTFKTDYLVLAIGVESKRSITIEGSTERCIMNMWKKEDKNILFAPKLDYLPKTTELIMLGSGLTMIDALMTLVDKGYRGNVTIISRSGKIPHP